MQDFSNLMIEEKKSEEDLKIENDIQELIKKIYEASEDITALTDVYTNILLDENVVAILIKLSQNKIFEEHFPEFYQKSEMDESVINCQQNTKYHRFGLFRHILFTIENVGQDRSYTKKELKILKWTMLLHDIGKPFVKIVKSDGTDSFSGHDEKSLEMAKEILDRFAFEKEEKDTILALIKYHDKYLNEGELTQDNLVFLAEELKNNKKNFQMLIDVKLADNKAKSIDVYNRFMTVVSKYTDFEASYFKEDEDNKDDALLDIYDEEDSSDKDVDVASDFLFKDENNSNLKQDTNIQIPDENLLTREVFDKIYDNVLYNANIGYSYLPIVDINNKCIYGYITKVILSNVQNFENIMLMAKDTGRYEKLKQLILLNVIDKALEEQRNKDKKIFVRIDVKSFLSYNNKQRIYDALDKDNIVILFENYDKTSTSDLNEIFENVKKKHGNVGFYDFQNSDIPLGKLEDIKCEYLIWNFAKDNDLRKIEEVSNYCIDNPQKLIVINVEDKKDLKNLIKAGACLINSKLIVDNVFSLDLDDAEIRKIFE